MKTSISNMKIVCACCFFLLLASSVFAETYFYTGDIAMAYKTQEETIFLYHDRLGTDSATLHLPFGQILSKENRFAFTGKERDSSGLTYFSARYYNADLGRFTSVDKVESLYPYQYVHNNPLNAVDPSGMRTVFTIQNPQGMNLWKFGTGLREGGVPPQVFERHLGMKLFWSMNREDIRQYWEPPHKGKFESNYWQSIPRSYTHYNTYTNKWTGGGYTDEISYDNIDIFELGDIGFDEDGNIVLPPGTESFIADGERPEFEMSGRGLAEIFAEFANKNSKEGVVFFFGPSSWDFPAIQDADKRSRAQSSANEPYPDRDSRMNLFFQGFFDGLVEQGLTNFKIVMGRPGETYLAPARQANPDGSIDIRALGQTHSQGMYNPYSK